MLLKTFMQERLDHLSAHVRHHTHWQGGCARSFAFGQDAEAEKDFRASDDYGKDD